LLDNPLALAGGGGILALIAAYFVSRRRRGGKIKEVPLDLSSTLSPQVSSLTANSVFRSTGGQSVDTSHTSDQTDFSQAGPGSIDTDEVDPVAEADVYMAYGRDVQAEEILLEAKQKDSKRYAIHLKLLEIYLNRKDAKQFETLASDLYGETGGVGADWEKAAAMGLKLDPANPLFSNSAPPSAPASFDADATLIVTPQPTMRNTVTLPGELSQLAEVASAGEPPAGLSVADDGMSAAADLTSLDFDLGLGDSKPTGNTRSATDEALNQPDSAAEAAALDFDLAAPNDNAAKSATGNVDVSVGGMDFSLPEISSTATPEVGFGKEVADLDFDLGIESNVTAGVEPVVQAGSDVAPEPKPDDDNGLEFDVSLSESTFLGSAKLEQPSFNMSSIDLDLKAADPAVPAAQPKAAAPADTAAGAAFDSLQVSTSVNPDFETMQSETLVNPQFGHRLDQTLDNDFTLAQSETLIHPHFGGGLDQAGDKDFSTVQAETVVNQQFGVEQDLSPEFEIASSEEVTTKLDLAKAYEEMGDLEGARELLQEVVKEGNASQREKAQAILSKISV
jgi:pilus assembly protein FimV